MQNNCIRVNKIIGDDIIIESYKPKSETKVNVEIDGTVLIKDDLRVLGNVSASVKEFVMTHPLDKNKILRHICIEGPCADLIYRGNVQLVNGEAFVDVDATCNMCNGTFQALSENHQVHLTNRSNWDLVKVNNYDEVSTGKFKVISNNKSSTANIDWMVLATRKDVFFGIEELIEPVTSKQADVEKVTNEREGLEPVPSEREGLEPVPNEQAGIEPVPSEQTGIEEVTSEQEVVESVASEQDNNI